MILTLIRHGHATNQATGHTSGHYDWWLSEEGHQQARLLAEYLASHTFAHIYSSDLLRAKETVAPIVEHHTITPLTFDTRLRERTFGPYDGMEKTEIMAKYRLDAHALYAYLASLPTSESADQLYHRARNLLQQLHEQHANERILCITHGWLKRAVHIVLEWLPITDIDNSAIQFANTGITSYEITPDGARLLLNNSTQHLI